jgi:hypothetical protein
MTHNFNSERLPGNMFTRTLALGAFLTALLVAAETKATNDEHERLKAEAEVVSNIREGERAVYVLPGCRANGHYIGQMLEPHIQHLGSTHHLAYPEKGFSLDSVKRALLEARANDDGRPATIYASSMGGMVICDLLLDEEFREQFGEIEKIILDSSPADEEDLDPGTRFAMFAAEIFPPSRTIASLYRKVVRRASLKHRPAHSQDVPDELVDGHVLSSADTHLSAVEGQAYYIKHRKFTENELQEALQNVGELIYIGASHDRTVKQEIAHQKYARAAGRAVLRIVDWERERGSHAAGPEYPHFVAEVMARPTATNDTAKKIIELFATEAEQAVPQTQDVAEAS